MNERQCRLFTVPYFSLRSSRSNDLLYGRPSYFQMFVEDGRRGFLVVEGERQTVPRPLSRFDTHPSTRNQDGSCKLHLDDLTEILGTLNSV